MCIFTNDKDIPSYVRLSTRTLQYLVIPLLSIAIIIVGARHLDDCPAEPHLPIWHIVAGCSGIMVPILYLLFDKLNPALASRCPLLSELLDNTIVFIIPVYILFEVSWLITGTVWIISIDRHTQVCNDSIYMFSLVVIINFWIHLLTPIVFMVSVCCSRIFPFLGYCTYWKVIKNIVDLWTFNIRFLISVLVSLPLSCAMIGIGVNGVTVCKPPHKGNDTSHQEVEISTQTPNTDDDSVLDLGYLNLPVWLICSGVLLLFLPCIYTVYDKLIKSESVNAGCRVFSKSMVICYLLLALVCALVGFLWIFGTENKDTCNKESHTYKFAFASLICLNILMDVWICVKISIVLYWSLLSDE